MVGPERESARRVPKIGLVAGVSYGMAESRLSQTASTANENLPAARAVDRRQPQAPDVQVQRSGAGVQDLTVRPLKRSSSPYAIAFTGRSRVERPRVRDIPEKGDAMAVNDGTTVGGVTYKVTPEYLSNAATSTTNTATEIDGILAQIRSYVVSLEASWQGVAYNTFQTLMAEYDIYAKMLHDSLTDIASGLRGNYVNYTESEQTNINNLQSLDSSLPAGGRTIGPANLG